MSTKIPSSLVWLIDKRARLDAEIQKTQASLTKAKKLIEELSSLQKDLNAIDHALSLHEIKVDLNLIQSVKSHYRRVNLPHGELTRSILGCLRQSAGKKPVSKSEINAFILTSYPHLLLTQSNREHLFRAIHTRLKTLAKDGVIQRHHDKVTGKEGLWSLPCITKDE